MAEIVIGVPGPWRERTELIEALVRQKADFLFAGGVVMEQSTNEACGFDFTDRDENLPQAVETAGQGAFSDDQLDAVRRHNGTAWLIFDELGLQKARTAARFARMLLDVGGVAVKVDSSGLAHTPERWLRDWSSEDPWAIYGLFVVLVGDEGRFYSCGMHTFDLPDAAVPSALGTGEGAKLLNHFNVYRMVESPMLNSGETFSVEADSPRYRLSLGPYVDGYEDTPMLNPHGLWTLSPIEARPARTRWSWPWKR